MKILAIDPSIKFIGWALHDTERRKWTIGTIILPPQKFLPDTLNKLGKKLNLAVNHNYIDLLVVEYPEFFQGSVKGAVAAVNGTTFGLAAIAGFLQAFLDVKTVHYKPSEWKGQIPKKGMTYRFKHHFGYAAETDHEAEAALLLLHHLSKCKTQDPR